MYCSNYYHAGLEHKQQHFIAGTSQPGATVENLGMDHLGQKPHKHKSRRTNSGVGLQTSGLVFGGNELPVTVSNLIMEWIKLDRVDLNTARIGILELVHLLQTCSFRDIRLHQGSPILLQMLNYGMDQVGQKVK